MSVVEFRPKGASAEFLVQFKDQDGFWCNIGDTKDQSEAIYVAEQWSLEMRTSVRVVKGAKRELVRVINATRS